MPYDQMHLFLDETGDFLKKELRIIGGVLLFGTYDDQKEDNKIKKLLINSINDANGKFPEDLHFGNNGWQIERKNTFLQNLCNKIQEDNIPDTGLYGRTFGVSITYEEDISDNDNKHDNRYRHMLLFLIQHLLFVSKDVAIRLNPKAKIYITIASRQFVFNAHDYNTETLAKLGWRNWQVDNENKDKKYVQSVNDDIIRSLINPNNGGSKRWPSDQIEVMNIQLNSLDYNSGTSPKGLYLADLQIGAIRRSTNLLTSICNIQYSPKLRFLHEMHSSLSNNDLAGYLKNNNRLYESISKTNQPKEIELLIQNLEDKAILLANDDQNHKAINDYLTESSILVDQSNNSKEGLRRTLLAEKLLGERNKTISKETALRLQSKFLTLQSKLSYYNHTGNLSEANIVWDKFLEIENSLRTLPLVGIKFKIEIRNRRAVSLMDHFSYDAANEVINKIVSTAEDLRTKLASLEECQLSDIPSKELGACYGTLGQLYAFQGNKEAAKKSFDWAKSLFSDSKDIERQWVYLGHLACDMGDLIGRPLWKEVTANFDGIDDLQLIVGDGCQFLLALQLKGKLVFGTNDQIIQLADLFLAKNHPLNNFSANVKNAHPYGLIIQMAGLICARAWKETNRESYYDRAIYFFRSAATHYLPQGELLLKLLANVCTLRKLLLEFQKAGVNNDNQINIVIDEFITHAKDIGEHAWSEDDSGGANGYFGTQVAGQNHNTIERAQKIVDLIRFNYW